MEGWGQVDNHNQQPNNSKHTHVRLNHNHHIINGDGGGGLVVMSHHNQTLYITLTSTQHIEAHRSNAGDGDSATVSTVEEDPSPSLFSPVSWYIFFMGSRWERRKWREKKTNWDEKGENEGKKEKKKRMNWDEKGEKEEKKEKKKERMEEQRNKKENWRRKEEKKRRVSQKLRLVGPSVCV